MNFYDSTNIPCFGVAGNFTGHLEQAGEAIDFANVKTKEANAPKAIFPTYIPAESEVPGFLTVFPFDSKKIIFPKDEEKLQIEPECAVIFEAAWKEQSLIDLKPVCFGASNDCSIRKQGARKISEKKNWGACSKGFSENQIAADGFEKGSILDDYRIASFLIRDSQIYDYGENSAVRDYSYIYKKLTDWMLEKFNGQKNEGPAEDIHSYLVAAGCPERIMVSIGATRYTAWGESNFLQNGDKAVVVVYPESKYTEEQIKKDAFFMQRALDEARQAFKEGEIPIGAVVVCRDRIIARAHNLTETLTDVTAHAEMQAITAAANMLGGKYLTECTLYVTVEPCVMCAGAIGWAQIPRIVYGCQDEKRGYQLYAPRAMHPRSTTIGGILEEECRQLMQEFFISKR